MDLEAFKNANSIAEVYALSKKLKEEGFDIAEVNRLATKRKKELVSGSNRVNTLTKILPKSDSLKKNKVSNFVIEVKNLNSGNIVIAEGNKVIL